MANGRTGKGDRPRPDSRAARRRRTWITGLGVAVVAAAIVGYFAYRAVADLPGARFEDQGNAHIQMASEPHPPYNSDPPTSGPHYNVQGYAPVPWKTIDTLVEGQFVHNLEHGGIAILYNCPSGNDCTTLKNQLQNYVTNLAPAEPQFGKVKIVMTPYTKGMQKKIALVAWHYVDFLDVYDQNEITRFYENHVDQGPEQIA